MFPHVSYRLRQTELGRKSKCALVETRKSNMYTIASLRAMSGARPSRRESALRMRQRAKRSGKPSFISKKNSEKQ